MNIKKQLLEQIPGIIENRYLDIYCAIIENSFQSRDLDEYELHHYIPSSIVPNTNVASLTLREHYIAHVLLTKFLTGNALEKMLYAINMMLDSKRYPIRSSRIYESLKTQFSYMRPRNIVLKKYTYPDGGVAINFSTTAAGPGEVLATFNSVNSLYDSDLITAYHPSDVTRAYTQCTGMSDRAKLAIGAANSVHQAGEGNSQFGTRWIHSLEEKQSKKIRSTDEIPEGWQLGRKMKFNDED